jgi:hypothetical protein
MKYKVINIKIFPLFTHRLVPMIYRYDSTKLEVNENDDVGDIKDIQFFKQNISSLEGPFVDLFFDKINFLYKNNLIYGIYAPISYMTIQEGSAYILVAYIKTINSKEFLNEFLEKNFKLS